MSPLVGAPSFAVVEFDWRTMLEKVLNAVVRYLIITIPEPPAFPDELVPSPPSPVFTAPALPEPPLPPALYVTDDPENTDAVPAPPVPSTAEPPAADAPPPPPAQ